MRLHINGLAGDHGNIAPLYTQFRGDADVLVTDDPLRRYATGRWPDADVHVLHLHWIDHVGGGSSFFRSIRQAMQLFAYLTVIRARRSRVVWTMHNAAAHEVRHARLERLVQRGVATFADVVHVPNPATLEVIGARWPGRVRGRCIYLPLPDPTSDLQPLPREEARRSLGVGPDDTLVVAFGLVRRYKGLDTLAHAFHAASAPNLRLIIAGKGRDPDLTDLIAGVLSGDEGAELRFDHQSDEQLVELFSAADWVALPYTSGENSGVLTMALAFGVPLIVTDLPGLVQPLVAEPLSHLLVRRAGGVVELTAALETAARMQPDEWAHASAAAGRLHRDDNCELAARYRAMYEGRPVPVAGAPATRT